ncbi:Asparaginase [Acanthopleuribacter pedis]|uniref:Asparaginase n=1 Tax=Acanthopleuribacter pedis TaxID=442870 RepID=A0A8J7U4E3_9BACT|nr:asparaginase [Acanthopleuribacter pedis]
MVTGAQLPFSYPASDAPNNIVNSVRVAALRAPGRAERPRIQEVVVVFGSKIIRATRCRKVSENQLEAFDSVNYPVLGRIGIHITVQDHLLLPNRQPRQPQTRFDPNVALVHVYPGLTRNSHKEFCYEAESHAITSFTRSSRLRRSAATPVPSLGRNLRTHKAFCFSRRILVRIAG